MTKVHRTFRKSYTLLPVLAAALAITLSPAHAQSTAGTWGDRAAAMGADFIHWGSIGGTVLYLLAIIFLISFAVLLFGIGKRNGEASPRAAGLALLAAMACASAPTLLNLTSQTITGAAPSITGDGTSPVQF